MYTIIFLSIKFSFMYDMLLLGKLICINPTAREYIK